MRPAILEKLCLCQMGMRYTKVNSNEAGKARREGKILAPPSGKGWEGTLTVITGEEPRDEIFLPQFFELHNNNVMKLRQFDAVIRRHKFRPEKGEHEFFFSELLLFYPWRIEDELFPYDAKKCAELYIKVKPKIDRVKSILFPHLNDVELGRAMVENFEFDMNPVGAAADPEGEQAQDLEAMADQAAEYGGLDPQHLGEDERGSEENQTAPFFRAPPILDMEKLQEKTRELCWEQLFVLERLLSYCRDLTMARNSGRSSTIKPPLLIVHGGGGTGKSVVINIVSLWVQKILNVSGDDINSPYIVKCAPTGMAAQNIEGQTLHSTFKFRFGNEYFSLSDKARDTLRDHFKNVRVVIIDEMSMMKADQLYHLHMRLCDVKQDDSIMGGVSVLLVGKLFVSMKFMPIIL